MKQDDLKIELTLDNVENLELFSQILKKDINTMLNESLELYFENEQQKLIEKNQEDENALTNLDFNEFWDDVEI
ncbi:MAG: hypothetical protein U9O56_10575 [Campylobacterota bacterium]|nr:hypothetical protein [Campylobacterota bacterium]